MVPQVQGEREDFRVRLVCQDNRECQENQELQETRVKKDLLDL